MSFRGSGRLPWEARNDLCHVNSLSSWSAILTATMWPRSPSWPVATHRRMPKSKRKRNPKQFCGFLIWNSPDQRFSTASRRQVRNAHTTTPFATSLTGTARSRGSAFNRTVVTRYRINLERSEKALVRRNCNRQTNRLPIHDHAVDKLDTTNVSGIGDLMRDIAGERAGVVIPAFFLFRVRL